MINIGDEVLAIRDGGADKDGLPVQRPRFGQRYRVTGVYKMKYGLGCTLEGMDPSPYRGYLFFVANPIRKTMLTGRYFVPIEKPKAKVCKERVREQV